MKAEVAVGDLVSHCNGGPAGRVTGMFQFGNEYYLEIEGQLGALPLWDAVKIEED